MEPVTSLRAAGCGLLEPKPSWKRPESALQLATPSPIKEIATSCGQLADRRDAHMVTHSNAIQGRATKPRWGKQGLKWPGDFREILLCVFAVTVRVRGPAGAAQSEPQRDSRALILHPAW